MSEYIICESKHGEVTDYMGVKHSLSHYEKREEIVRCRDCKYHQHTSYHRCDLYMISHEVEPDGFCSWGERRLAGDPNDGD